MSDTSKRTKLEFVMVHGFGHGAWCWYKIRTLLEASDYKVTCLDLKASGTDPFDPNTIFTFEDYNKPLIDLLSNLPENEKVILVGHSAGGLSLTYAIHRFAKKIHMAIYVAANMLKHGFVSPQDYEDDSTLAAMRLRPGPLRPIANVRFTEGPDSDTVQRVFMKTMHDRVIRQDQQDAMIRRWPPSQVFELESEHSPFFSTPTDLFGFLLKAVASINSYAT
ncbi:hypothetical protein REPUB_Repub06bG0124800 [Reevesia pubescens]